MVAKEYYGRLLTANQVPEKYLDQAQQLDSMYQKGGQLFCQRCDSHIEKEWLLPNGEHYCRGCLIFGRLQEGEKLYYFSSPKISLAMPILSWTGQLTPYQEEVSQKLLQNYQYEKNTMVHAVTGAGKTEMVYGLIAHVLEKMGRVALASPRIDVCRELDQRLRRDFTCSISLLHAASQPYNGSPLVITTTHQLMKFYHHFDLVIVDEVDAFPFVGNAILNHAVKQAKAPSGHFVCLTATSTKELESEVKRGHLAKIHLPRRFHGNPLILPKYYWQGNLMKALSQKRIPHPLYKRIRIQRQSGFPLLIFFPNIAIGEKFTQVLKYKFPEEEVAFVSSISEERSEIVNDFRQGKLTILVSTTILERGVTFPKVDVFVCMANHRLFNSSSLIQIGGRVGRSQERPDGAFYLFHEGITKEMRQCYKEIKAMNSKGGFDALPSM